MNGGWVKLHRQFLENRMWQRDHNSVHLFCTILMLANKKTGTWSGGRKQLADWSGLSESATYRALKRLEKAKMCTLRANNKYTDIHICKWSEYQEQSNSTSNNQRTTSEQPANTLTRIKNKEIRNIHTSNFEKVHESICKLFSKNPNQYKLSNARKEKLRLRLKDLGEDGVIKAVTNLSQSKWHMGDNDRGWVADPYWCLSSYEKAEEWASRQSSNTYTGKLSEYEIKGDLK